MELYKEKLCEFLTSTEVNFNHSKQIFELYQSSEINEFLKTRYLMDFLNSVEILIQQSSVGWKTRINVDPDNPDFKYLLLYKDDWEGFSMNWDVKCNDIGLCQFDNKIDRGWRSRINSYLKNIGKPINSDKEYKEWLWIDDFTFDLDDIDTLFNITPIKSEISSMDISIQLMNYSSKYEQQIKHIISLKEK